MFGKKRPSLTEQDVLNALKGVKDPDLHRDLVDLGMIKNIQIGDGTVGADGQPDHPRLPDEGADRARRPRGPDQPPGSDWTVQITMGAEVRGKGITEKGDIPGVKNVIAVGSGKGGVGKSTMAAAIAYGLQSYGSTVGLMDADVYGPSIPHLVGASGRPMARGERIQPIEADGLRLMSMGFLLEPERAVIMRGPMLHGIMQQFLHQVDWGDARLPGHRPAAGDRRRPPDPGAEPPADRRRGRLHAAGGRAPGCHPGRHHVPPVEGSPAGDGREHELLRRRTPTSRSAAAQGPRRGRGQAASSTPPATSASTSSAAAAPAARPSSSASRSWARSR